MLRLQLQGPAWDCGKWGPSKGPLGALQLLFSLRGWWALSCETELGPPTDSAFRSPTCPLLCRALGRINSRGAAEGTSGLTPTEERAELWGCVCCPLAAAHQQALISCASFLFAVPLGNWKQTPVSLRVPALSAERIGCCVLKPWPWLPSAWMWHYEHSRIWGAIRTQEVRQHGRGCQQCLPGSQGSWASQPLQYHLYPHSGVCGLRRPNSFSASLT